MKKIIAAFDGLKYSESTREYAIFLANQTNSHLIGVFMDDPTYNSFKFYELAAKRTGWEEELQILEAKDKATRDAAAENFVGTCQQAGLEFTVHHDRNIAVQDLKHESIYADLLIIDSRETLTHYTEMPPTRFIRDLLGDAQCPVLIVPPKYKKVEKIIILCDGEPSCVYAIKMFSYLLPQLKSLDTVVISVNPVNTTLHLSDNRLMKEFMNWHYPDAKYNIMKGLAEDEIIRSLKQEEESTLVVLGAYRRGPVSRWFRESMADILMHELKLPLFIAHH